jgi:hypothetical protein
MQPNTNGQDIWQFNRTVTSRLMGINIANLMIGQRLMLREGFWRGVGVQAAGWAFINLLIALVGGTLTNRRLDSLDQPFDPEVMHKEARNLRRLLWINTGLDVFYMLGGWRFARQRGRDKPLMRGMGIGIVIQGALLFVFDLFHARRVP